MKLRLQQGVVKIRVSPDEKKELESKKLLSEQIFINNDNQFTYTIDIKTDLEICLLKFGQNGLSVTVPEEKVRRWFNSKQIGIKETIITDKGEYIVLTLEEDLPPRKFRKNN